jgi:hypothetical protein
VQKCFLHRCAGMCVSRAILPGTLVSDGWQALEFASADGLLTVSSVLFYAALCLCCAVPFCAVLCFDVLRGMLRPWPWAFVPSPMS